jgi:hypothetical protein
MINLKPRPGSVEGPFGIAQCSAPFWSVQSVTTTVAVIGDGSPFSHAAVSLPRIRADRSDCVPACTCEFSSDAKGVLSSCGTSSSTHACCTGCVPPFEIPSIVVISATTAAFAVIEHDRAGSPLMCTVHAPHCAIPQPNFVHVRPSVPRSTHRWGLRLYVRRILNAGDVESEHHVVTSL